MTSNMTRNWSMTPMLVFFLVLFVLKVGVGDTIVQGWSWWWITATLWGPLAVAAVARILGAALMGLGTLLDK